MATDIATSVRADGARKRKRAVRLSTGDRVAIAVMVGIPVIVTGALIWFPTFASIGLSFTNWDGIGGLGTIHWAGTESSAVMCGWVDGAIRSGERAAEEVLAREAAATTEPV